MSVAVRNDAELVGESLAGNRDAFGQIVARYQSLVCSLAYSATGSLSQSEDLAQETFVTAWKQLTGLREPEKLRAWLCGIARNLINNALRRQGREPSHHAEPLEEILENHSPEPLPVEQTISKEEEAILWRSLEHIPEIYREPLILFYREHQSIETVAANLDLTEDTVKQRLSRGRKLLQERVLAFVEGALERTNPGKQFPANVMAALPLLATTAKAVTATVTATKGGAMAKATGGGAFLQAIAALSPILLLGGFFGFKMGGDARQSSQQRELVATFWRIVVGSLVAFVVLPILLITVLSKFLSVDFSGDFRQRVLDKMTIWMGLMYAVVPAALILWAWQRRRKFQSQPVCEPEVAMNPRKKKRFVWWVTIAMIGAGCMLVITLSDSNNKVQNITAAEVQKLVAAAKGKERIMRKSSVPFIWVDADDQGKEAEFSVLQHQNGYSNFWITLRENGKQTKFSAPVDDATLALLKEQGIKCPTYVQGRDFEVLGWPGKLLPVFCIFILAIGGVVLLRKPGKFNPQKMDVQQTRKMQQVERVANKVFGTGIALVLMTAAIHLGLITRWKVQTVAGAEVRQVITAHKNARFEVYQYHNGTKELWIREYRHPDFILPADESTLSLLAENGVAYQTYVQGRDFGYRNPNRWVSLLGIFILTTGAAILLRWAWKKGKKFPAPAEVSV